MFPDSRNMDPHTQHMPHLREHVASPHHYHPNWEPNSLHMQTDSFKHPSGFEPWPYSGNIEHNSCCNHSYPPGYYNYRPPYFNLQHPPQMYYPGPYPPYPPYPDSYPPLFVPPYYTVDHARFDRNHCCGCPNHVCHRNEGSSVRIEEEQTTPKSEEEPDKGPKDSHSSLIGFPGSHYSLVPGNSAKKGKAEKSSQSSPVLDFHDKLKGLQRGLGDRAFEGDDKFSQLPCPIYWLPYADKPEDPVKDKKEIHASSKPTESWPSIFKRSPLKLLDNGNPCDRPALMKEERNLQNSVDRAVEMERKIRTIPVVDLGSGNEKLTMPYNPDEENKLSKSVTGEKRDVSMKNDYSKKQQAPVKSSKLPPVCLRVDPLLKKNISTGKTRPLTSPGCKEKGKINKNNSEEVATIKNLADKIPGKDVMAIDVKGKPSCEISNETASEIVFGQDMNGIIEIRSHKNCRDASSDVDVAVKGETDDFSIIHSLKIDQDKEEEKVKNMPPDDAALLIQSVYRGFNVRRWQPLEKLRKIGRVAREVTAVKVQIQNYEASSERNVKQREAIGEAIMNLLLQLDTIQGLPPSLREVRKSVARELVLLEEKLDQLPDQVVDEHQQGTTKKDDGFNPAPETISGQPTEENVSEHKIEASSMGFEHESDVLDDKTSCALEQDDEVRDDLVPSGSKYDQAPQDGDDNDRNESISLSNSGEVSAVEKSIHEDVVSCPPDSEATGTASRQQPEEDYNCNNELLEKEAMFSTQEALPLKPDEGGRQSLLEDGVLEESPGDERNMEDAVAISIKDDESIGRRDGESIVEEGNADISEKIEMTAAHSAGEVERLENDQLEPVLSTTRNPNPAGDVEDVAETQNLSSAKHQSGGGEIPAAESSAIFNDHGDANSLEHPIVPIVEPISSQEAIGGEGGDEQTNSSGKYMPSDLRDHEQGIIGKKLVEENAELRQMLESLLNAGREQMRVISDMNERVRNLERRLWRKEENESKSSESEQAISFSAAGSSS